MVARPAFIVFGFLAGWFCFYRAAAGFFHVLFLAWLIGWMSSFGLVMGLPCRFYGCPSLGVCTYFGDGLQCSSGFYMRLPALISWQVFASPYVPPCLSIHRDRLGDEFVRWEGSGYSPEFVSG
jgi:hypothetical protein